MKQNKKEEEEEWWEDITMPLEYDFYSQRYVLARTLCLKKCKREDWQVFIYNHKTLFNLIKYIPPTINNNIFW